jgi:hypothetical protein
MAVTAPDWLTRRGGTMREGPVGPGWFVLFDGGPQYELKPIPTAGKHSCQVMQTINGRYLESSGGTYPSAEDAVRGGLEDLRKALGW